jgi:hypothetical protein
MTLRPAARTSIRLLYVAVAAVVAVGGLLGATGCGNLALSADAFAGSLPAVGAPADGGAFGDVSSVGIGPEDVGPAQSARAFQGSPLCGIPAGGTVCDPDQPSDGGAACQSELPPAVVDSGPVGFPGADSSTADDASAYDDATPEDAGSGEDVATPPLDAGTAPDSSTPAPPYAMLACRVVEPPGSDAGFTPMCQVPGQGVDGARCTGGQDCAAGFECVGEPGQGVCRHYCCSNDCSENGGGSTAGDAAAPGPSDAAPNGPTPFCDIEPMSGYDGHLVPVCVTKPSCTLFQPCPPGAGAAATAETCTIVDATGTTACIPPGTQGVGESCEEAHCKAGLACWGIFPGRTCVQLCDASNPCPDGASCQSNYSNFGATDTSAGICPPPM